MNLIVVESPYAPLHGDPKPDQTVQRNLSYVRWCMNFCLIEIGAAPYASHALYTQPGVLRDWIPSERKLGMRAGFSWGKFAEERGVFCDRGLTDGMRQGIQQARKAGQVVRYYQIARWIEARIFANGFAPGSSARIALLGAPPAAETERLVQALQEGLIT